MNKLKSSLTCSNCSKIFKDPVELPCDDYICREHLKEKDVIKQNKIKCSKCKQEFGVKDTDFKSVKAYNKLLLDQVHLSQIEINLRLKIEESIKIFYERYEELTQSKNLLDLDCHNHFQEVRRQIDLQREKLKKKIDKIALEMIENTKKIEASCLNSLSDDLNSFLKCVLTKSIGEDLKEVAEKFRDPQLLIKTIEEMNLKQQEAIATIQSKLNEMTRIKEDIKASNQFKPNLTFEMNSFGQLSLGEYSSFDPFKSQILTGEQSFELIKLCEFNINDKFKLLYSANRDGFGAEYFHSKCDGHANTLTILKASGSSYIFGGFTSVEWESLNGQCKSDPIAFLFSLTNKDNQPCKMRIKDNQHQYAIDCDPECGPSFANDIFISSNANTNINSFSNLGYSFKHPQYAGGTFEADTFLAGSYEFQLSEIEVYKKEEFN